MRIFHYQPAPRLRPYIARIWGWQAELGEIVRLPQLLPGTGAELYFHFGSHLTGQNHLAVAAASELICLRQRRIDLGEALGLNFLAVRFRIGMLPRFTRIPPSELLDVRMPLDELWGVSGMRLQQNLNSLVQTEQRVALIEAFLCQQLAEQSVDPLIEQAQSLLYCHAGALSIDGVAKLSGLGRRQLERRWVQASGISPSEMRSLCRFQHAVRALLLHPEARLSALALRFGYYDQAHFCRDFARRTGRSPLHFLRDARTRTHFYNTSMSAQRILPTP